jgi:chemotaxis protein MotB
VSDDAPKKPAATGVPAWVMTFADLMTLLMCFFVLLLSFSEMDVAKYKQLAGSMKEAFGVQRKVEVKEPPKGVNVIATEFSAGRPNPTPFNVVEQITSDEVRQFLDTGGRQRKAGDDGEPSRGRKSLIDEGDLKESATQEGSGGRDQKKGLGSEGETAQAQAKSEAQTQAEILAKAEAAKAQQARDTLDDQMVMLPKEDALRGLKAKDAQEREQKLQQTAKMIRAALRWEIKDGAVDVETEGQKIVIRIREKASFSSGGADLRENFRPILDRVGQILKETEGRIIVSGHTDERPIATSHYRSNWDLSASRAVSVVHELIDISRIPSARFSIEGMAETQPVAPNDSAENRARNRRVEIKLLQGDDLETTGTLGLTPATGAAEPAAKPMAAPAKPAVAPQAPVKDSKPAIAPLAPKAAPPVPKAKPLADDPFVRKAG